MEREDKIQIAAWLVLLLLSSAKFLAFAQTDQLTLKRALELARSQNRELKADSLNIERAQQQVRIIRSLFLPNARIDAQLQHYFQRPAFFGFGTSSSPDKIPYTRLGGDQQALAQASLVQPLYRPGASAALQKSKLEEQQSRLSYTLREVDIVAEVKRIYVRILVLEKRLKLQKESIARNQKALEDSRSLLAQGRALRVDTLRAYTSIKNLEPDILRLQYAIEVSKQQLNVLTGEATDKNVALTDSLVYNAAELVPSESDAFNTSLTQRPDLRILSVNKWVSDKQISIARAASKPSLNLISQFQLPTQTNDFKFNNASYPGIFFAGAQLSIPIFSGFANSSRVGQAKIERRQADLIFQNAAENLKTEVKQVLASIDETSKRIQTQLNVAEVAETSYSITKYRYSHGIASRLELIDAELALTTAKSNYLEAVYDYQAAKIELNRTLGKVE